MKEKTEERTYGTPKVEVLELKQKRAVCETSPGEYPGWPGQNI